MERLKTSQDIWKRAYKTKIQRKCLENIPYNLVFYSIIGFLLDYTKEFLPPLEKISKSRNILKLEIIFKMYIIITEGE